jgi:hypothetical protein
MDEASAKLSSGPTDDEREDQELAIWAGTVPARIVFDVPVPDTNGAMSRSDIEIPVSVRTLLENQ